MQSSGTTESPFAFIADKLRSIPLVSAGMSQSERRNRQSQVASGQAVSSTTGEMTDERTVPSAVGPATSKLSRVQARQQWLGKRDVSPLRHKLGDRIQSQSEVLFRRNGITASTANLVRKPAPTTTTTRRPKTTPRRRLGAPGASISGSSTTSSTARPKTARPAAPRSKMIREGPVVASSAGPGQLEPISSYRASSLQAIAASTTGTLTASERPGAELAATPPASLQLTRATQPLLLAASQPVNQRRQQQPVLQLGASSSGRPPNRFASSRGPQESDPLRGAGENWALFSRPDGRFSLFEGLVLASNILIVSTVIFVILFNLIKSMRRRRSGSGQGSRPAPDGKPSSPVSHISSMNSAGLPRPASSAGPSPAPSAATTTTSGNLNAGAQAAPLRPRAEPPAPEQADGTGQVLASKQEFKGQPAGNKAMAIVQPSSSEPKGQLPASGASSNKLSDETKESLKEELLAGGQAKLISRSVSDLSGVSLGQSQASKASPAADQPAPRKAADDMTLVSAGDKERVAALEQLFTGGPGAKPSKPAKQKSNDSLESIELPAELVPKQQQQQGRPPPDEPTKPSPNLLLGQVDPEPAKAEAEAEPKLKQKREPEPEPEPEKPPTAEVKAAGAKPEAAPAPAAISPDQRPENPMGRDQAEPAKASEPLRAQAAEVKNHQLVVNKLDKRKTNLEIVDLRDESVTGKMRPQPASLQQQQMQGWISMDGVAVVQAAPPAAQQQLASGGPANPAGQSSQPAAMSPSEIIESRFHVDYAAGSAKRRRSALVGAAPAGGDDGAGPSQTSNKNSQDSMDSKQEEHAFNNIDNELEQDNRLRNRKYFVYIVHDGHFTARKECIARIELPPKRRITLAELRQLISGSQDISLSSLRRNRFKFVTETYRLLNENEDAAVLHQVYPTQGVFLKLNVTDNQDGPAWKAGSRPAGRLSASGGPSTFSGLSATSGGRAGSGPSQATIASRRRANARSNNRKLNATSGQDGNMLPAIELDLVGQPGPGAYRRSKSSVQVGRRPAGRQQTMRRGASQSNLIRSGPDSALPPMGKSSPTARQTIGEAASDLGANVLSGAKKLFNFSSARSLDLSTADQMDAERRRSITGMPVAEMFEDKVRIITTTLYCSRASCARLATIRCGLCNQAHYCSVHCRVRDWPQHRRFCTKPRWKGS